MKGGRLARLLLRLVARVVPRGRRGAWREEWEGELEALLRADRRADGDGAPTPYPGPVSFVVGALPHALWIRKEEWTMDAVWQDLRFAGRVLRRSPGFALVAVVTLALGIGVNASVFSMVNGLVLRSPPGVVEPERMVQIARSYEEAPRWDNWSWPALREIRGSSRVFEGVIGHSARAFLVGTGADARPVVGDLVTGNYFEVLGLTPAAGRLLQPSDDVTPGAHPVAVLGWDLWQERWGGDPGVVGTSVQVGGRSFEVVGVAPRGFQGLETVGSPRQLFIPAAMHEPFMDRLPFDEWGWSWIEVAGRLEEGVSYEAALAAMDVVSARLREAASVNEGIEVLLAEGLGMSPEERTEAKRISLIMLVIAGLVLLLTCANVANLFIARATTRASEMGVRRALGAGRARLVRQLGTESLVLALAAAALAAPLVWAAGGVLPTFIPYTLSVSLEPDGRVFASLVVLGALAGVLFGAGPAAMATRRSLTHSLRDGAGTGGSGRTRVRDGLVVAQLAVSLGLLATAALLGRSVMNASAADPGFEPRGLLVAGLNLDITGRYDDATALDFFQRLQRETLALPGVEAVAIASQTPFLGPFSRASQRPLELADDPEAGVEAEAVFVGGGYFEALGIDLVSGRTLAAPGEEPEPVAVVNQTLARMFWPGESAVGKQLDRGDDPVRVVGVVQDVRSRSLRSQPRPAVYQPLTASFDRRVSVHVRTTGDPTRLAGSFRRTVASLDPGLPVTHAVDLHSVMAESLGETHTIGLLVGTFAGLALLLSVTGLYGLIAYGVSQRIRELGIRVALGAEPGALVRMVLRRGLGLTAVGLILGLGLSLVLGRAVQGLLYDVRPANPAVLAVAAVLLLAAATLAAWVPARRATRLDAAQSLRDA